MISNMLTPLQQTIQEHVQRFVKSHSIEIDLDALPPPLDPSTTSVRPVEVVIGRALGLNVLVAVSFGFDALDAMNWIEKHDVAEYLEANELELLKLPVRSEATREEMKLGVEALWALCWSLQLVETLSWSRYCEDWLTNLLPDLLRAEAPDSFVESSHLRSTIDICQEEYTGFCIQWAFRNAGLKSTESPFTIREYMIRQRRHALNWILSTESWSDISLDT